MTDLLSVAKKAGVSRATAARVFSQPELVRKTTLQRVLAAAEELAFRPNRLAQQLRTQATRIIGVLLPDPRNPVFAEQLLAMELAARQQGYALLVTTTGYDASQELQLVEEMLCQRVDGLVLTVADAENSEVLAKLQRESVPYVLVYNQPTDPDVQAISVDNRLAMYDAAQYLLALGHRQIGMVAGPMAQSDRARLRYDGYCAALREHGITPRPVIEMASHTRASFPLLQSHVQGNEGLTALLCSNDLLALSLISDLQRHGYAVPDDMSVIGFDGIELGELLFPSLCSVVQPREAIGREAVAVLLAMMRGEQPDIGKLPHRLRPGESAGPLQRPDTDAHRIRTR
ncbi:substrate-binding domain-containing protein [Pokkaliibacter sp. MBI-7]|uniref:substrate-binding domain-containing protein n=1 Tax=Pokkaliibacter sp. MBI-7 TaxID=3040600 RepID=UPI002446B41F|nr:substrate-binding domain-containing protein [Pokkaliibacter sp. MBI-7]MDH2436001.1 substrate-binding domain-containing protein [Pokkaliibacter sp. MBI-7]